MASKARCMQKNPIGIWEENIRAPNNVYFHLKLSEKLRFMDI